MTSDSLSEWNFGLRLIRLTLRLEFTQAVVVDPFPGAALHGLVSGSVASYARELTWPWPANAIEETERAERIWKVEKNIPRPYCIACGEWGKEQLIPKGNSYSFDLILFGPAVDWWRAICEAIERRGKDARTKGKFAGNFRLTIVDGIGHQPLRWDLSEDHPVEVSEADLQRRVRELEAGPAWEMIMATPLAFQPCGRNVLGPDEVSPIVLFRGLLDRYSLMVSPDQQVNYRMNGEWAISAELHAADAHYTYSHYAAAAERIWLRGVLGTIHLTSAWRPLLPALALGEMIGLGLNTEYGKGRFLLATSESKSSLLSLADVASMDRLWLARDEVERDDLADSDLDDETLERMTSDLAAGLYKPMPLRRADLPKAGGGIRELQIPTPRDMAVQRVLLRLLRRHVEARLEDESYAYRQGHSRFQAAAAVEAARDKGYPFVFRADVERFFDTIQHDRLDSMVRALPIEPAVADLVMGMMKAPLECAGKLIPRTQGVPQGAPLSPLLANLYLDGFDEAITRAGYRLIRFADDFLIAAKTESEAREAGRVAADELAKLGLAISVDKTKIVSFDQGFTFLGFLFARSLVIERQKQHCGSAHLTEPASAEGVFFHSADISHDPLLRTVHVEGYGFRVGCEADRFVVRQDGAEVARVPFQWIDNIVVTGSAVLTPALIHRALEQNVPIWFVNRSGRLEGKLAQAERDPSELWLEQRSLFAVPEIRLVAAKTLIHAKILNQAAVLRRHSENPSIAKAVELLHRLADDVLDTTTQNNLVALEGRSAAIYFGEFPQLLAPELGFTGRHRRPPTDPVNILLSIGYTRLRTQLRGLVEQHGLSPFFGILHESRLEETGEKRHDVLVSDLMEPFRPLVDRVVLSLFRKSQIKTTDFSFHEKEEIKYRLSDPARALFFESWERTCRTPTTYLKKNITLIRVMDRVVFEFRNWLKDGCTGRIDAYRIK